jgi:hypothetical protein
MFTTHIIVLLQTLFYLIGICAVSFEKSPVIINTEYKWLGVSGFQALTNRYLIGKGIKNWYGSKNHGESWEMIFMDNPPNISAKYGIKAVVITDGVAHNFGSIPLCIADKRDYYQSVNSTYVTTFRFNEFVGRFEYMIENRSVSFSGMPYPGATCGNYRLAYGCPFRILGRGVVKIVEDGNTVLVQSAVVYFDVEKYASPLSELNDYATTIVSFRSTDGGYHWTYAGVILAAADVPQSEEGPNENDLVVLNDRKTIMCVTRLDAGDGFLTERYSPYATIISSDGGFTWEEPVVLPRSVGCARPRLVAFDSGIVMSGGRLSATNHDVLIWTNENGDGKDWHQQSVSYYHNLLSSNNATIPKFNTLVNDSLVRQSTSYTSLLKVGPNTGVITYSIINNENQVCTAFSMQFQV